MHKEQSLHRVDEDLDSLRKILLRETGEYLPPRGTRSHRVSTCVTLRAAVHTVNTAQMGAIVLILSLLLLIAEVNHRARPE